VTGAGIAFVVLLATAALVEWVAWRRRRADQRLRELYRLLTQPKPHLYDRESGT